MVKRLFGHPINEIRLTSKSVLLNLSSNPAIWVETLTEACFKLAKNRIGALIIIERNDWVDEAGDNHYRAWFTKDASTLNVRNVQAKIDLSIAGYGVIPKEVVQDFPESHV